MGRYYNGTISGKFWFGIQDSHDASNFTNTLIIPPQYYSYYVCGCDVKDNNEYYCYECFSNYDSHLSSMEENDKLAIDTLLLAFESNNIKYNFDTSDLEFINTTLQELENIIGSKLIKDLEFKIENIEDFEYYINYSAFDDIVDDIMLKIIARWCFGKQIQTAIINVGYCY